MGMTGLLVARNVKIYFKDKMTFLTSLLSPLILLVLFFTFLRSVYVSSLQSMLPEGVVLPEKLVDAFTGGWLISSILGVSSVTIAFCSNILMVQDKVSGCLKDLLVTPVRRSTLALSYYLSNYLTTSIVCFAAAGAGLLYLAATGWYLSLGDVLSLCLDLLVGILFGTALAALVESRISSQGGISAVATLVSSMYGFICGAYMPISQFSEGIRNLVSFNPGTYGTVLLRHHLMHGAIDEMAETLPEPVVEALRQGFDNQLYFFGHRVELWQMFAVQLLSALLILGVYILLHLSRKKAEG